MEIKGSKLTVVLLAGLCLSSCSSERRDVRRYLEGYDKAVTPALQQGKVVDDLLGSLQGGNFKATWPTLRKNVEELEAKVKSADADVKQLAVPAAAAALNQLAHDDMAVLEQRCELGIVIGDKTANPGKGFAALRTFREMRPQVEELKALQARQVELDSKLELELGNLRKKEHL